MSNTQSGIRQFLISILLAASAACFVYPLFFETLANIRQVTELSGYESSFRSLDDGAVASEMEAARKYNEGIADEQRWTPFEYRGENASDPVYESTLGIQTGGIMGDLSIPTIGVSLPIAHGTREEDLEYRCGHMYGTSLPIGGESTHAVIAGHTGLPTAELFTHLTDLKEGDIFLIRVLGETHRYEIDSIRVVWPEEESAYLGVENGQDLVTLYTCTPYGINDRRLLVRGRRIYPDLENGSAGGQGLRFTENNYLLVVKAILLASLAPLIFMTGVIRLVKGRKKSRKKKWRDAGNGADAYEKTEDFRDDRFEYGYRGTGSEVCENEFAARHPACRSESYSGSVTPGDSAFAGRFETYGSFCGDADHVYRGIM